MKCSSVNLPWVCTELGAFFAVVEDPGRGEILRAQARVVHRRSGGIGVVDFGAVDLLEGLHGADQADQLQVGVVVEQVTAEVERQWCDSAWRHEVAYAAAPSCRSTYRSAKFSSCWYSSAQHRVAVARTVVGLGRGDADADHGQLGKTLSVGLRFEEVLEEPSVQVSEVLRQDRCSGAGRCAAGSTTLKS